jgi:hypothetical protein
VAYFTEEMLKQLSRERAAIQSRYAELVLRYVSLRWESERAREYAIHGFCRRLGTLVHAIDQVYEALPPDQEEIPSREAVLTATIAIQAFVFNTFGCLENLAWIWVSARGVTRADGRELDPKTVGLWKRCRDVRRSFSHQFRAYLETRQDWFDHIENFRHALAHRIPLYIPPFIVRPENAAEYHRLEDESTAALRRRDLAEYEGLQSEQKTLARFRPWMTHSHFENAPAVVFHAQLLADYSTVDEFGRTLLQELDT